MDMKHTLPILSVFLVFAFGQGKPKVSLFPGFPSHHLYVSDEVTLRCKDGGNVLASGVTWFFKNNPLPTSNATLKFPAVTVDDSGTYQCEHGGQKSEAVEIKVLDMLPQASLSVLNNADTVIGKGGAVLLKLYMEEGLNDWWCRYTEGDQEMWQPIKRDPTQSNSSLIIHADVGEGDGRTYWCMDAKKGLTREERSRSNAIKLTATGKMVRLQMSEKPAWSGDDVTVSCDVWGGPKVDQAVFYKDGREITGIQKVSQNKFTIQNITKSSEGVYHCDATYRFIHISKDAATHSNLPSDQQVLTVIAGPPKPRLDCTQMKCGGPWSSKPDSYLWLYTPEGATDPEKLQESKDQILSGKTGTYTCSAKWTSSGFSRKSNECRFAEQKGTSPLVVVVVVLFLLGLLLLLLALCICKRRTVRKKNIEVGADGGYEEVGKKDPGKEGEYELLKISQEEKDKGQYDTIKGQGKGKGEGEGEYEALKAGEAEGTVYHTLKEKDQGKGEYEALKTAQAEVYHTLKGPGEAEGKGEYEALKTAQAEVYHTLKGPGEAEAEGKGEYETLKTAQTEVYHTLGQGQGAGVVEGQEAKEESPYEELKKEKDSK